MKLCFFGPEADQQTICALLSQSPRFGCQEHRFHSFSDYDSFVSQLPRGEYDAVFITENNANGMEGVIALRNLRPELPVIWFSNDEGFGCQAYRLSADFFHTKPITAPVLEMALSRLFKK